MNFELLSALARMRRDELLREADVRRLLIRAVRNRPIRRGGLALRAVAAVADAAGSALG